VLELYLVRHGEAEDAPPPGAHGDAARMLSPRGQAQATRAAAGLRALGVKPDAIWQSPYTRAQQTAAALHGSLGGTLSTHDDLTPDSPPLLAARRVQQTHGVLVVVAHMPVLPGIAVTLGLPRLGFGTAAVAHVRLDVDPRASASGLLARLVDLYPVEHWQQQEQR
jgi:phosphohistidine phosphatase